MSAEGAILERFPDARLLGEGSESRVYALSDSQVLRIPKVAPHDSGSVAARCASWSVRLTSASGHLRSWSRGDVDGTAYIVGGSASGGGT